MRRGAWYGCMQIDSLPSRLFTSSFACMPSHACSARICSLLLWHLPEHANILPCQGEVGASSGGTGSCPAGNVWSLQMGRGTPL